MDKRRYSLVVLVVATVVAVTGTWLLLFGSGAADRLAASGRPFELSDRLADLDVVDTGAGTRFRFDGSEGEVLLTPEQFAAELRQRRPAGARSWLLGALNITDTVGILWVALGLFGQALFAARMLVQWVASERRQRSVVPTAFWWLSLGGASILIAYFVWRVDIVGIVGQSTGWLIYSRNLWLIHRGKHGG